MVQLIEEIVRELPIRGDSAVFWSCRCCGHELFERYDIMSMNRREITVHIDSIDFGAKVIINGDRRIFTCSSNRFFGETETNSVIIKRNKLMLLTVDK